MELSNTITTFNDKKNTPLLNVKTRKAILKVMIEDEEKSTTDANKVTAGASSHASS